MKNAGFVYAVVLSAALGQGASAQEVASRILAMSADELTAVLQDAGATTFDKAKACQRLAVVGGAESAPILAAQLGDEDLNAYARSALQSIADPAADAALRDAAKKLRGRQLVGVLNSIGERRDDEAVELLQSLLPHGDEAVRSAAATALGQIGSKQAAAALNSIAAAKDGFLAPAIEEALLACAESLAGSDPDAATAIYNQLIESEAPKHVQMAAMLGRIRLPKADAAGWLKQQLRSEDADLFDLGLLAARQLQGDAVTVVLVEALPSLKPQRRALALRALGDRATPPPLTTVVAEIKSDDPAVRAAAVDVLAKMGSPEAAAELINVAFSQGEAAPLAQQWLKTLRSDVVDRAIAEQVALPEQQANVALIELIGARRIEALKPHLLKLTSHQDEPVRRAALTALGQVGELADVEVLIERALGDGPEAETKFAQDVLRTTALRLSDRDGCAQRLAQELPNVSQENQSYLLKLLREMGAGSTASLQAVVSAAKAENAALKEAATRELGAWPTADAGDALLDLVKNDPEEKYQIRALRGYIRIARQLQLSDEDRLRHFHTAMEVAARDEEKRLALDVLTRIPSAQTLELAASYLDEPALTAAAAEASISIADKLIGADAATVAKAMGQFPEQGVPPELAKRAAELLQRASGAAQ